MNNQIRHFLGLPKIEYGLKELPKEKEMEYQNPSVENFSKLLERVKQIEEKINIQDRLIQDRLKQLEHNQHIQAETLRSHDARLMDLMSMLRNVENNIKQSFKDINAQLEKRGDDQSSKLTALLKRIELLEQQRELQDQSYRSLNNRLSEAENELQTHSAIIGEPSATKVEVDLSSLSQRKDSVNQCGEIVRIDERSLVIDEIRQKLISLRKKKEDTVKQFEEDIKNNRRHPAHASAVYNEIEGIKQCDRLLQEMIGDNPILVTRKETK